MSSFLATRRFLDFLAFLWRNDTKEYNKILREKGIPTSLSLSLASAYLWDQTIAFAKISREMKRVERKKRHRAYFEQGTFWPCTKIDKFWWNFCEETCNNWRSNEWIFYSAGSVRKKMWAWRPIFWNFETLLPCVIYFQFYYDVEFLLESNYAFKVEFPSIARKLHIRMLRIGALSKFDFSDRFEFETLDEASEKTMVDDFLRKFFIRFISIHLFCLHTNLRFW